MTAEDASLTPYGAPALDEPARRRALAHVGSSAPRETERKADLELAEHLLWERFLVDRDAAPRQELILHYLPYARKVAGSLYGKHVHHDVEFQEYVQWSTLGLIEAIDRYDPARGARFNTYAHLRMLGAIRNGLQHATERQEQISLRRRLTTERLAAATRDLNPADTDAPPMQLLSDMAEISAVMMLTFMLDDTGMLQHEEAALPDKCYQSLAFKDEQARLRALVDRLTPREQSVIRLHYLQGLTQQDIAQTLGLTKGRVSQLHEQALQRLRKLIAP